jgi:uncharacterized membrane protein
VAVGCTAYAGKATGIGMVDRALGNPFHPILVNIPIGAWVASLIFDLGSHRTADCSE